MAIITVDTKRQKERSRLRKLEAEQKGAIDYKGGVSRNDPPYKKGSIFEHHWLHGWEKAAYNDIMEKKKYGV